MAVNGIEIRYGNIAPEAKENFLPETNDKENFVNLSQLQGYNMNFPNYGNPCELYSVVLDGSAQPFPRNLEFANLGLWSKSMSGDDGTFATPIVLTLTSDKNYSSPGLTFTFDTYNQIYPTHINIHWYRNTDGNSEDLGEVDYNPDSAHYYCANSVNGYNKVVVTFTKLNMPKNRLKLRAIDYGYGTAFRGDELRNIKLIQELDPISTEISINTSDFTLDSKSNIEYSFQAKQPLTIYFNGKLKSKAFVKSAKRMSKGMYVIQAEDYIGLLDSIPYYGGIYNRARAVDILTDIFRVAKVSYDISAISADLTVTGYIPYTTCRKALMQVAFAIQAVVDTSNSENVNVYFLKEDLSQETIPLKRIMQGQNFENDETVSSVEIVSHTYKPITDTMDVYNAKESGIGQNIFVNFNEPLHDLSITNGNIVSFGANYAIIDANEGCILKGQKYEHTTSTKRKNNPAVLAGDVEKIVTVSDATLVSETNVDNVLNRCYNWIIKTDKTNLKIIEGKHNISGVHIKYGERKYGTFKYGEITPDSIIYDKPVNVGDNISVETAYLGVVSGRVVKQQFRLNGGIIVKDTVLR